MPDINNIRELKYTSPSGKEFNLLYEETTRTGGKKLSIHDLPQQDIAIVQELGNSPKEINIDCYLVGPGSDKIGDDFYNSLDETGPGILQHPRWGDIKVIPVAKTQTENMTAQINRVNFSLQFFPYFEKKPLSIINSASDNIKSNIVTIAINAISDFANNIYTTSSNILKSFRDSCNNTCDYFVGYIRPIIALDPELSQEFETAYSEFKNGIDLIYSDPQSFMENYQEIFMIPYEAPGKLYDKLVIYYNTAVYAVEEFGESFNDFIGSILTLVGISSGASESVTVSEPENRPEAISIDSVIENINDIFSNQITDASNNVGYVLSFEISDLINNNFTYARKIITDSLFSLKTEKKVIIDAPESPFILVWKYYNDISMIEKFIQDNNLTGNELILVPAGKEVVFYV